MAVDIIISVHPPMIICPGENNIVNKRFNNIFPTCISKPVAIPTQQQQSHAVIWRSLAGDDLWRTACLDVLRVRFFLGGSFGPFKGFLNPCKGVKKDLFSLNIIDFKWFSLIFDDTNESNQANELWHHEWIVTPINPTQLITNPINNEPN